MTVKLLCDTSIKHVSKPIALYSTKNDLKVDVFQKII